MKEQSESVQNGQRVQLTRSGLLLGGELLPLYAGSMHYFRARPEVWRPALLAMKSLGLRVVDTYVPWGVHERLAGEYDFGERDPRLDLAHFLRIVHELGLRAIVRPGPHINAELTWFGIPERVIWNPDCQARSAGGAPVVLPVPPLAFPVPSYASEAFQAEAAQWLRAFADVVAPFVWPDGPIVLYQIDNEGALYFRDGVYDQDYHPDALSAYRRFIQAKYASLAELRATYGDANATFPQLEPPKRFDATNATELARHLDWAEFQEQLLADAFVRMRGVLQSTPLGRVPCTHNLPLSEGATPLDPARLRDVVDLIGLDYYHGASPPQRSEVMRRTSELAVRSELTGRPAFACELGAGFPPFFPPLTEADNAFTVLTALAYGLRGFNVYMAVERDRWIGAPINQHGKRRKSAEFWQKLTFALERTRFHELERRTPVQLVVPRAMRRLARVLHAFGPLSAALFQVLGGSPEEACFEDDLGLDSPLVIAAHRFLRALEAALDARGIPYAIAPGDLMGPALERASWSILVCTGALEPELVQVVSEANERGRNLTVGPFAPERDHMLRPLEHPLSLLRAPAQVVPTLLPLDGEAIELAVDRAVQHLALDALDVQPRELFASCHVDALGTPRVLFVINPSDHSVAGTVASLGNPLAADSLTLERFQAVDGKFAVRLAPRSVRMLELHDES